MHDPAPFRPTPLLGINTEEAVPRSPHDTTHGPIGAVREVSANGNGRDPREERDSESLQRAMEAIPPGRTPEWYARMSAVHSYRSADASAAAFEMSGKAFGEAQATRKYVQQLIEEHPIISAKAKRTLSGSMKAVSIPVVAAPPPPPPLPPLELPRNASQTGSNYTIPLDVLAKLEQQLRDRDVQQRERDAEERGKQAVIVAQANALAAQQAADKARRDRWTFILGVLAFIGGGAAYALSHLSIHP